MFEQLETEIGQRLRTVSIVVFALNLATSILCGVLFMQGKDGAEQALGLLIILGGILLSWCIGFLVYGFARLVNNSEILARKVDFAAERMPWKLRRAADRAPETVLEQQDNEYCCAACGAPNEPTRTRCWSCGASFRANEIK